MRDRAEDGAQAAQRERHHRRALVGAAVAADPLRDLQEQDAAQGERLVDAVDRVVHHELRAVEGGHLPRHLPRDHRGRGHAHARAQELTLLRGRGLRGGEQRERRENGNEPAEEGHRSRQEVRNVRGDWIRQRKTGPLSPVSSARGRIRTYDPLINSRTAKEPGHDRTSHPRGVLGIGVVPRSLRCETCSECTHNATHNAFPVLDVTPPVFASDCSDTLH